jgi:hypothetical protein
MRVDELEGWRVVYAGGSAWGAAWWRLFFGLPLATLAPLTAWRLALANEAGLDPTEGWFRTAVCLGLGLLGAVLVVHGALDAALLPRLHRGPVQALDRHSDRFRRSVHHRATLVVADTTWHVPNTTLPGVERGAELVVESTAGSRTLLRLLARERGSSEGT